MRKRIQVPVGVHFFLQKFYSAPKAHAIELKLLTEKPQLHALPVRTSCSFSQVELTLHSTVTPLGLVLRRTKYFLAGTFAFSSSLEL